MQSAAIPPSRARSLVGPPPVCFFFTAHGLVCRLSNFEAARAEARKLQLWDFKQDLILFAHAHLVPARSLLNFACFPLSLLFFPRSSVGAQSPTQCTQASTLQSRATFSSTLRTAGRFTTRVMEAPTWTKTTISLGGTKWKTKWCALQTIGP